MKKLMTILVFLFLGFQVFAQTTITGTVSDSENEGIPGANVWVKGNASIGTIADANGKYSIDVPADAKVLGFSFMGMETVEVAINGQSVIDVTLQALDIMFDDVVVTALGIKREKKALGYSVQDVNGDEVTLGGDNNVVSALSGKVAGVQISSTTGAIGATAVIKIRGNKSFTGSSSPLFVVDGIPISNGGGSDVSADFGNAAQDIDMENVENISVLKGPAATALYGSRGSNGVVLITTKKGSIKKGIGVSLTSSIAFDNVYILPDYQDEYGQGYKGSEYYWKLNNPSISYKEYAEASWNWSPDDTQDQSWGARLDQGFNVIQVQSPLDENGDRIPSPWISRPDNIKNFYETGVTSSNSISLSGGNEFSMTKLTLSNVNQTGTTPNTDQKKINIGFNSNVKLNEKLKFEISGNYNITSNENLPKQGTSLQNPLYEFNNWFGRQTDVAFLKDHYLEYVTHPDGHQSRLNWLTGYSGYNNNPYWNQYMNLTSRERKRVFGNINTTYTIVDGIDLVFRVGTDNINEARKSVFHSDTKGTLISGYQNPVNGSFWQQSRYENETNADLMLNINKNLTEDITLLTTFGANYRYSVSKYITIEAGDLLIPDFYTTSAVNGNPITYTSMYERKTNSLFGTANLGYKDYLFLDLTYRQDWSSTLPSENRSYGYAASTLGFIFTDAFGIESNILDYGKIRISYAEVGNDTSPYSLAPYYLKSGEPFTGAGGAINLYTISSILPTFDLKPERTASYELGGELKFFGNRLGLDLTYYNAVTKNQLMNVALAPSEGFSTWKKNAGEIKNSGVEIQLYATPIKKNDFAWNVNLNYSKNQNEVLKLDADISEGLQLNTFYYTQMWAKEGEEWGTLYGRVRKKDADGNYLIRSNGMYAKTDETEKIGNVTPDFIGSLRNSFNYKNFNLSFLLDVRVGGDIVSRTKIVGQRTGILEATVKDNQRVDGIIIDGVYEEGVTDALGNDISGQPNTTVISSYVHWNDRTFTDMGIIDGSFIKLREASLSYAIPSKYVSKLKMQSATVSLFGRNLALLYTDKSNDVHIDPEVAATGSVLDTGYESFNLAPSRSMGVKININF